MTSRRVGSPDEIKTPAVRAVSSGDLHELVDGRTGVYLASLDKAIGEDIVLHTRERLELTSGAFAAKTAGVLANFDMSTQALVVTGGVVIGRYSKTKDLNATTAEVILNATTVSA